MTSFILNEKYRVGVFKKRVLQKYSDIFVMTYQEARECFTVRNLVVCFKVGYPLCVYQTNIY